MRFAKDRLVNTGCTVEHMSVYSPGYDLTHCPHRIAAEAELGITVEVAGRTDAAGAFHRGVVVLLAHRLARRSFSRSSTRSARPRS